MVEKFRNYIERGSWEEDLESGAGLLDAFCWVVFILAGIYFGPTIVEILTREVIR